MQVLDWEKNFMVHICDRDVHPEQPHLKVSKVLEWIQT